MEEEALLSRVIIYGLDRKPLGEFVREVDRGWMLTGNPSVSGGGQTTLSLTSDLLAKHYWQLGHMVAIYHDKLPTWAGVIDTPWDTGSLQVTCYNAEYLLNLRAPEQSLVLDGSVGSIIEQMLLYFNAGQDMFVRVGNTARADQTTRQVVLDQRTYWEQIKTLLTRAGCEMTTRIEKDADGRLVVFLDIATLAGVDTGFLYVDGQDANAYFREARLDGEIVNRVVGLGDESGQASRLITQPYFDEASIKLYGLRSRVVQFRDVRDQGTLDRYAEVYVHYSAYPKFSFLMDVLDKGDAYRNVRLGNLVRARISNANLPAGQQGWYGVARVLAMAYSESTGLLTTKLEAV